MGRTRHALALSLVSLCLAAGAGLLLAAVTAQPATPPQPQAVASGDIVSRGRPPDAPGAVGAALPRSEPVGIEIPAIELTAKVVAVAVDEEGDLEVPPLEKAELAGWYKLGASPGEPGNSVIVGHVDSYKIGPAVFFNLGKLKPGDVIEVSRKDNTVATFSVDGVRTFPKTEFPYEIVYGTGDEARLRLVTCGGRFDKKTKNYPDNVVVFATLVSG